MSAKTIHKSLRVAYPVTIFLAVLANSGMRLVQAESSGFHLFPNNKHHQHYRTLTSNDVNACLKPDLRKLHTPNLTCPDDNSVDWSKQNMGRQLVNVSGHKQESHGS